jgi:hypothetical protein
MLQVSFNLQTFKEQMLIGYKLGKGSMAVRLRLTWMSQVVATT